MLRQIEGSRAVAETVARCRPEVVCAYPISPQTHIIEAVGAMVKSGALSPCEFINVESEFAAMSVSIGASAAGARAYTATASQGLLFMMEAVYNASGLGLPIVMTLANRTIGGPINIWNDHSDAMSVRDTGWIQLFAETNQEAVDLHVQAFAIAERLSLPVMVCMDGFILTHAIEGIDVPEQATVDAFLPPSSLARCSIPTIRSPSAPWSAPRRSRRSATSPISASSRPSTSSPPWPPTSPAGSADRAGVWSGPTAPRTPRPWSWPSVRCSGPSRTRWTPGATPGSGSGSSGSRRSVPSRCRRWRTRWRSAQRVVVVEKAFSVGFGGVLSTDVALATHRSESSLDTVVAGLGGRPITRRHLETMLAAAGEDRLEPLTFLDLDTGIVEREQARMAAATTRPGPTAEFVLRDLGTSPPPAR